MFVMFDELTKYTKQDMMNEQLRHQASVWRTTGLLCRHFSSSADLTLENSVVIRSK